MILTGTSLVCLSTCSILHLPWKRLALALSNLQLSAVMFTILVVSLIISSIPFHLPFFIFVKTSSLAIMLHIRTVNTKVTVSMRQISSVPLKNERKSGMSTIVAAVA